MLRNYIKIAWRNLLKNKGYSLINIGGLASGMAVAMLISFWIKDELSYNKSNSNYPQVAQVLQTQMQSGDKQIIYPIPFPLGQELQTKYGNDFKYVVMADWTNSHILQYQEKNISQKGSFFDIDGPKLLDLKMISGTLNGLDNLNSIMLSETLAKSLFGDVDPLGKIILLDNKINVSVTGVYKNLPSNSEFNDLMFIAPWNLYTASYPWVTAAKNNPQWDNNSYLLFVQIADHADMKSLNKKINRVKYDHLSESQKYLDSEIFLHPMADWHLKSNWENGIQRGGFIQYIWLFGIVGLFVLLLACINFMNLSTAHSIHRSKEVGIRKSIGGSKGQLARQFLGESFLITFLSFAIAILLVVIAIPFFNSLTDKDLVFPFSNTWFWLSSGIFVLLTGLLAGSYPALFVSSFQPAKVLKGTFSLGSSGATLRKALVVFQFMVSVLLIIGTITVEKQIQYIQKRPLGYEKDGILMVEMATEDYLDKYHLLRDNLLNIGAIEDMSFSSSPLTAIYNGNGGFDWPGKDPNSNSDFSTIWVTHDYGNTIGWNVKEGRDFSREFRTDSTAYILNEAAVKYMELEDPVGKSITWGRSKPHQIIGVVEDMIMESPFETVHQAIYILDYAINANYILLKLNPARSISESVAQIKAVFLDLVPSIPFTSKFVDDEHNQKFAAEERIGQLAGLFALLAIFISCLGLIGLTSFILAKRKKEISIRKVVGASLPQLWSLLTKDFFRLILLSCLLAIPLGYFLLSKWLQNYDHHILLSWKIFALAFVGLIIITIAIVSIQAVRASFINPIINLRNE